MFGDPKKIFLAFYFVSTSTALCMEQPNIIEKQESIYETIESSGPVDPKGTYDCINDNKKYLSPFHGWVWLKSRMIEKYYRFGNIETERSLNDMVVTRILEGDATIQLVHQLFHAVGSDFSHVKEWSFPAAYFDTEILGKILATLEQMLFSAKKTPKKHTLKLVLANNISEHIKKVRLKKIHSHTSTVTFLKKSYQKLQKLIPNNQAALESITQTPLAIWFGKDVHSTGDNDEALIGQLITWANDIRSSKSKAIANSLRFIHPTGAGRRHKQEISITSKKESLTQAHTYLVKLYKKFNTPQQTQAIKKLTHAFYNCLKQSEHACTQASTLASVIIKAYQEAGHFAQQKNLITLYPPHTPTNIILASLWSNISHKKDLVLYFKQFTPGIIKKNVDFLGASFNRVESLDECCEMIYEVVDPVAAIKNAYETICYTGIDSIKSRSIVPPLILYDNAVFFEEAFSPCSEIAILNIIRFLLTKLNCYNKLTRSFDIDSLEEKIKELLSSKNIQISNTKPPLVDFFKKYPHEQQQSESKAQQLWAEFISNVPGVKYLRSFNTQEKTVAKDNLKPSIHMLPNQHPINHPHKAHGEQFFLHELSGYPDTVARAVGYALGFECKNLQELCNIFDMVPHKPLDESFSDDAVYETLIKRQKAPARTFAIWIQNELLNVTLSPSTGHLEFSYSSSTYSPKALTETANSILSRLYYYFEISECQNIIACYSPLVKPYHRRAYINNNTNQPRKSGDFQQYVMLQDLFDPINSLSMINFLIGLGGMSPQKNKFFRTLQTLIRNAERDIAKKIIDFTELLINLIPQKNDTLCRENLIYMINTIDKNIVDLNDQNRTLFVTFLLNLFSRAGLSIFSTHAELKSTETKLQNLLNQQMQKLSLNQGIPLIKNHACEKIEESCAKNTIIWEAFAHWNNNSNNELNILKFDEKEYLIKEMLYLGEYYGGPVWQDLVNTIFSFMCECRFPDVVDKRCPLARKTNQTEEITETLKVHLTRENKETLERHIKFNNL